jgi:hypothetical protein
MTSFFEADQARLKIKMILINHNWYKHASVVKDDEGFSILIGVSHVNENIRNIISNISNNVTVKMSVI